MNPFSPGRHTARFGAAALGAAVVLASCTGTTTESAPTEPSSTTDQRAETTTTAVTESEQGGSTPSTTSPNNPDPVFGSLVPVVVDQFPHDPTAYTQGLEVVGGRLLESTGLYGESDRRLVDIETGAIVDREALPSDVFGEGLTVVDDVIIQLTWRAQTVYRADVASLDAIDVDTYEGEGWGICHDGTQLVMSNGSSALTVRDPVTFEPTATITVSRTDGTQVDRLNELECIGGQVWANVYTTDEIVVIDPTTGLVEASIDASSLRPDGLPLDDADYALNGIAHDPASGNVYLTGKWWPVLYEVSFEPS